MDLRYQPAFENRVRQSVEVADMEPFSVWAARPEDVIIGKLMAWKEGHSERHPADIFEMMLFYYLGGYTADLSFDETYVDNHARQLGDEVVALWELIKTSAREQAADD